MDLKEKFSESNKTVKMVLSNRNYLVLSIVVGILLFGGLYYLLVASVADNDIWIAVMMSGAGYVTFTIASIIAISALFGIYVSLVVFKINMVRAVAGGSLFGVVGGAVGALGVGCPTCGALLFSLVGAPLALTFFPFRGLELRVLGILLLMLSIYFVGKSIRGECKIKINS